MEKVLEVYIKTTPERLWEAITDPEIRARYNFGARQTPEWTPGSRYQIGRAGGSRTPRWGREPGGGPAAPAEVGSPADRRRV